MSSWWIWFWGTIAWIIILIIVKVGVFDALMRKALHNLNVRNASLSLKFISHFTYLFLFLLYIAGCFIVFGRISTVQKVALWVGSFGLFLTVITAEIWRRVFSSAAFATADIVDIKDYIRIHYEGEIIEGIVIDVGTYYLKLVDFTCETHWFPTSRLLDSVVTNYSFEEGENPMKEVKITIPYLKPDGSPTNLQQIYRIINSVLEEDDIKKHIVSEGSQRPLPFTEMGDSGIEVHLRVWCKGKDRDRTIGNMFFWWKSQHEISKRIYHKFMSEGLEFELPVRKLITWNPLSQKDIDKKMNQYISSYREETAKMGDGGEISAEGKESFKGDDR